MIDQYRSYGNIFMSYEDRLKLRLDEIKRILKDNPNEIILHQRLNYERDELLEEIRDIELKREKQTLNKVKYG